MGVWRRVRRWRGGRWFAGKAVPLSVIEAKLETVEYELARLSRDLADVGFDRERVVAPRAARRKHEVIQGALWRN